MRKSYDGLQALARHAMGRDPLDGSLYIFVNRRGSPLKCLYFDRSGFCIWGKRLETGKFIGDWRAVHTRAASRRLSRPEVLPTGDRAQINRQDPHGDFCWTELGAKHVGMIQSSIVTCRLHGIHAYTYLVDVLQRISEHPARCVAELTPRLWKQHFAAKPMRSDIGEFPV